MTRKEKIAWARKFARLNAAIERKWAPVINHALDIEIEKFLIYYKDRGGNLFTPAEVETYFSGHGVLLAALAVHIHSGLLLANAWYKKLKPVKFSDPTGNNSEWVADILDNFKRQNLDKVKRIAESTRRKINETLGISVLKGWSSEKTADEIRKRTRLSQKRARAIARTEGISGSNYGSRIGAKKTGLKLEKEWLSHIDNRTRGARAGDKTDHVKMDAQVAEMDGFYQLKGPRGVEFASYPGDPVLSAANRVNCRCTEVYNPVEGPPEVIQSQQREAKEVMSEILGELGQPDVIAFIEENQVVYKEVTDVMKELGFDFGELF